MNLDDGTEFRKLSDVPRPMLEHWYLFQMHAIGALIRRAGGSVKLDKQDIEDINRKQRIVVYTDPCSMDITLSVVDDK